MVRSNCVHLTGFSNGDDLNLSYIETSTSSCVLISRRIDGGIFINLGINGGIYSSDYTLNSFCYITFPKMEGQLQKVLVVGCTRGVGLEVTKILLGSPGKYDVHALVRSRERANKALGNEAARVKFIDGDVTKEDTLQPACNGMDAVVCTIGARAGWRIPGYDQGTPKHLDYLGVKKLSEAAASAMVPKFVLISSIGVTRPWFPMSIFLNTFMGRLMLWKLKGEGALREAYKKHEHISYYIVRPGGLTNGEGGKHGIVVDQGDKGVGWIPRADVAHVALACVNGACTPNSTFEIWTTKEEGTPDLSKLLELVPDKM